MIPRRVKLENFLTYGSPPVELEFRDDEPLWVLGGPNGAGKSAVFDAITFALFECHRGGKSQQMDKLIRHGATGFHIELEFEFNGVIYRIQRGRSKSGRGSRPTQKLEKLIADDQWQSLPEGDDGDELTKWVIDTLGQDYTSFSASVLLRQGAADELFKLNGANRNGILKKIIGFEKYEELHKNVRVKFTARKDLANRLSEEFDKLSPVTEQMIADAKAHEQEADDKLTTANGVLEAARARIVKSNEWDKLTKDRNALQNELDEAARRAAQSDEIRRKADRHNELKTVVPSLKLILELKAQQKRIYDTLEEQGRLLGDAERDRDAAKSAADEASNELKELRDSASSSESRIGVIGSDLKKAKDHLNQENEIAMLEKKFDEFPGDLADLLSQARTAKEQAEAYQSDAENDIRDIVTEKNLLADHQKEVVDLQGGTNCRRCGQPVTAEHAQAERARVAAELKTLEEKHEKALEQKKLRVEDVQKLRKPFNELTQQERDREALAIQLKTRRESLTKLGLTATVSELEQQIETGTGKLAELDAEARECEPKEKAATAKHKEQAGIAERKESEAKRLRNRIQTQQLDLIKCETLHESERPKLNADWLAKLPAMTDADLSELQAEWTAFADSNVVEEAKKLDQDVLIQADREARLERFDNELKKFALEDCMLPEAAKAACDDAVQAQERAALLHREAVANTGELNKKDATYRSTKAAFDEAVRVRGFYERADKLLGEAGLLRELLRESETEIIKLADNTLRQLTDQELSLEAEEATGSKDVTLGVKVRIGANATGIDFISGSQRFRVAVSMALAIGRFAAGKSRPIEAVIIDEGFGSLDEDGLKAMARNLQDLRDKQALKRIILVSHQKDFTEQFREGWQLTPGPNGTVATPFRNA